MVTLARVLMMALGMALLFLCVIALWVVAGIMWLTDVDSESNT